MTKRALTPWVMLAPALILLTVVGAYPLLYSLWVSTTALRPTNPEFYQGFVGLQNYVDAFGNWQLWRSLLVTAVFTLSSVLISLVLGFGLALLFDRDLPGFGLMRSAILIPMLITPIAVGILWRIMFLPDAGVLNHILGSIGLPALEWTGTVDGALASVILVDIWQWTPFMFLILFAGLRALPKAPFEAAQIDGASFWQITRTVTIPLLRPVILIAILLRAIDAVRTYDQIFVLTRGGPALATDLISVYIHRVNFRFFQVGYGAAVSWILMGFVVVLVSVFVRYTAVARVFDVEDR